MPTTSSQQENASQQPRGTYRKFTDAISKVKKTLIADYATRYINHCKANYGTCRREFLPELVLREAAKAAPNTAITSDDIKNEVKKRKLQQRVSSSGNTHPFATFDVSTTSMTAASLSLLGSSEGEANTMEVQEENQDPSPDASSLPELEQPRA